MTRWFNPSMIHTPQLLHDSKDNLFSITTSYLKRPLVKHYRLLKETAHGSTASIFMGVNIYTRKRYAVKEMTLARQRQQAFEDMLQARHPKSQQSNKRRRISMSPAHRPSKESDILKALHHPHIIKWVDQFEDDGNFYLVTEFVDGSVLLDLHNEHCQPIAMDICKLVFMQLVDTLSYVHSQGIIHGDIKPDNILVTKKNQIKLIDFGSAFRVNADDDADKNHVASVENRCGTPAFTAPEFASYLMHDKTIQKQATAIDIWALGITLYCMVHGQLPFHHVTSTLSYHQLVTSLVSSTNLDTDLKDLLSRMLRLDPYERLTLDEIKDHPWCNQP
ncbi:kinase-like protein [Hesseltinella vesiculosa]|uniref:Kinase-like protein n=1 Tax=Hesseltinella vesiculosa TaxID=101127 RepID=A0A1X2GA92_9FUNG|nr:kinase-like protein [Hesseltinella vesiculosa]